MRVLIVGVPGVGKSSIARGLGDTMPSISICEFGQRMAALGREMKVITSYDELAHLPFERRLPLQEAAAASISELNRSVAIPGHLVLYVCDQYVDALPPTVFRLLQPTGIIVIVCDPGQIYMRRACVRNHGDMAAIRQISEHQTLTIRRAEELARTHRLQIDSVANPDGSLNKATAKARSLWERFEAANG
jgi:adenylate kinase